MNKIKLIPSDLVRSVYSMFWMKALIVALMVAVLTPHVRAGFYECDMGWTDSSPVALSPISGYGPIVYVTFESSRGYDTYTDHTSIGYHHGGSNPIVSMTFSSDVANVELFMVDLDVTWEDLDMMSPVPIGTTGDFYLSGSTVRSSVNNGSGSIIYDTIAASEVLQFRFDDQLSNLAITELNFVAVPIPGAVWLLGFGLVGLIGLKRKKSNFLHNSYVSPNAG